MKLSTYEGTDRLQIASLHKIYIALEFFLKFLNNS